MGVLLLHAVYKVQRTQSWLEDMYLNKGDTR